VAVHTVEKKKKKVATPKSLESLVVAQSPMVDTRRFRLHSSRVIEGKMRTSVLCGDGEEKCKPRCSWLVGRKM
jgi:hypothetical protein